MEATDKKDMQKLGELMRMGISKDAAIIELKKWAEARKAVGETEEDKEMSAKATRKWGNDRCTGTMAAVTQTIMSNSDNANERLVQVGTGLNSMFNSLKFAIRGMPIPEAKVVKTEKAPQGPVIA